MPLTFTVDSLTQAQGGATPPLTYTVTGFVNGDSQATALTGAPMLTTTANSSSAPGPYPITIAQGTLGTTSSPSDYTFATFIPGTLTWLPRPRKRSLSGCSQVRSTARARSPSRRLQTRVADNVHSHRLSIGSEFHLTITGAGTVMVTANQAGDATHSAATPVTQSFMVTQAPLTVTATNQSRQFGQPNPTLTLYDYWLRKWRQPGNRNDRAHLRCRRPLPRLRRSGSYPITITQGTLASANYTFTPVNGTLTVSGNAAQTITFPALTNVTYGATPITLGATSTSSLNVSYTVTGPATVAGSALTITGVGAVSVTANQLGNDTYAAATAVSRGFIVNPATLTVTANNQTSTVGSPIPTLTYSLTGLCQRRDTGHCDHGRTCPLNLCYTDIWRRGLSDHNRAGYALIGKLLVRLRQRNPEHRQQDRADHYIRRSSECPIWHSCSDTDSNRRFGNSGDLFDRRASKRFGV